MDTPDIYFEIFDGGSLIRIEPLQFHNNHAELDWDKNWLKAKVTVKGGVFSGQFVGDFMTIEFELFKRELKHLDKDFKGTANFHSIEDQLTLTITGDGLGHFDLNCSASDNSNYEGTLTFSIFFDQTELPKLIDQLDKITKAFPILGNLKIKNE